MALLVLPTIGDGGSPGTSHWPAHGQSNTEWKGVMVHPQHNQEQLPINCRIPQRPVYPAKDPFIELVNFPWARRKTLTNSEVKNTKLKNAIELEGTLNRFHPSNLSKENAPVREPPWSDLPTLPYWNRYNPGIRTRGQIVEGSNRCRLN
jgi:hypothetical protein